MTPGSHLEEGESLEDNKYMLPCPYHNGTKTATIRNSLFFMTGFFPSVLHLKFVT